MYREALIKYVETVDKEVEKITGVKNQYVTKADIRNLRTKWWTEERAKSFLTGKEFDSIYLGCPWCYRYSSCTKCGYGRRHGVCADIGDSVNVDSDYFRLKHVVDILGIKRRLLNKHYKLAQQLDATKGNQDNS